jgi:hypothetical protein
MTSTVSTVDSGTTDGDVVEFRFNVQAYGFN